MSFKILSKTKIFEQDGKYWVSLRDYEVRKAIDNSETILVRVANEWMRLEPWSLVLDHEQFTEEVFKTKVGSKKHPEYVLWDFEWKPTQRAKEIGVKELEDEEYKQLSKQVL